MTSSSLTGPAAGLRIAAVEDETFIALDLQEILMGAGAKEVMIARDLAKLVDILRHAPPDIAIVNAEPTHDATTACARVLKEAAVPFFFATGVNDPSALSKFAVPIVTKPYSAEAILAALEKVLGRNSRSNS